MAKNDGWGVDPDVFCVLPWTHVSASVDGVWGRCCFDNTNDYDHYYHQARRPELTLRPNAVGCIPGSDFAADNPDRVYTPSTVLDSPQMRATRAEMLSGTRPKACEHCYWIESFGAISHRRSMNAFFVDKVDMDELVAATGPGGELDRQLLSIDLRLGNICGLTCIMCSFPTSSGFGPTVKPKWTASHIDPYRGNAEFWEDMHTATAIKYIYFAGGEPFLQKTHLPFLDQLIDHGRSSDIELHYNSNLMQLPEEYLDRFANFRRVVIAASCDGVDRTFEHIRRGATWDVFIRNVRVAAKTTEVWLDVSVQLGNIMELSEILNVAENEGVHARFQNVVYYPRELSILALPPEQNHAAQTYITSLIERCEEQGNHTAVKELTGIHSTLLFAVR
jgi:molybdenum cofactor biosynthesis enzyme MoaA